MDNQPITAIKTTKNILIENYKMLASKYRKLEHSEEKLSFSFQIFHGTLI